MPNRLIPLLLLAASLYAGGAAIVAVSHGALSARHVEAAAATKPSSSAVDLIDATTTLLPVVVVHPETEVPTLATVTVRPSRADRVEAVAGTDGIPIGPTLPGVRVATVLSFAGAGFDMPYYSFGRTLRHVTKE